MKKQNIFYSLNITLSPTELYLHINKIYLCLCDVFSYVQLRKEMKITCFLDVLMMLRLKNMSYTDYLKIQNILHKFYKAGNDIGLYINMAWEKTEDIHELHQDRVMDIFVQGREEIAKIIFYKEQATHVKNGLKNKESAQKRKRNSMPNLVVRVANGKIQPFVHLSSVYAFISAKLDASVFARRVKLKFYDYKNVTSSIVYRFEKNPAISEKYGSFLTLPRLSYKASVFYRVSFLSDLKKVAKKYDVQPFLYRNEEMIMPFPIPVPKQKKTFFVSPDTASPKYFLNTLARSKSVSKELFSLESFLHTVSPLTFKNLNFFKKRKYEFILASSIIDTYALSTNKIQFK